MRIFKLGALHSCSFARVVAVLLVAFLGLPLAARAEYPERPITLIVPFAAGGPTDVITRIIAEPMAHMLGQQVVVENVTGAGGTIAVTRVARAAPDGYQLVMGNLGTQAASVGLYPHLAYDPHTDFEPIMNTGGTPMVVAARKDLPVNDFREFMTYLKEHAANANYGTAGIGSTSHLTCLFLGSLLDVQPTHVPFRGNAPALNALIGSQIDFTCDQTAGIVPSIQGGLIEGLAVAMLTRLPSVPDMPTSAEQGLPDFVAIGWNAIFAPKGTPIEITTKLNAVARAALREETVQKRFADLSVLPPDEAAQTREALHVLVNSEIDKWVPIIKKSGVTAQ
jgi:tripartite-type tricarboxylate transporter receptor subunit TctC